MDKQVLLTFFVGFFFSNTSAVLQDSVIIIICFINLLVRLKIIVVIIYFINLLVIKENILKNNNLIY